MILIITVQVLLQYFYYFLLFLTEGQIDYVLLLRVVFSS